MRKKDGKASVFGAAASSPANNPFATLSGLKGTLPPGTEAKPPGAAPATPGSAKIVISHERKGRGGKTVTLIRGLALDDNTLAQLARDMRQSLGTGGTIEDGAIVLNGDQTLRAAQWLVERGYQQRIVIA